MDLFNPKSLSSRSNNAPEMNAKSAMPEMASKSFLVSNKNQASCLQQKLPSFSSLFYHILPQLKYLPAYLP